MGRGRRKVDKIIVHHSASPQDTTVAQIRDWHVNGNGWSDIGYHYIILADGTLERGRNINRTGAHCKNKNKGSIGICLKDKMSMVTVILGLQNVLEIFYTLIYNNTDKACVDKSIIKL
jgi:hypothetical protein